MSTRHYWQFEATQYDEYLCGNLNRQKLCSLKLCSLLSNVGIFAVHATFRISVGDIRILDVSGLWPDSLSANKRGILRAIVRHFLAAKMTLGLPEVNLQFGAVV